MPTPPKPADQRSRIPRGSALAPPTPMTLVTGGVMTPPPPAPSWSVSTKADWAVFWASPLARYVIDADVDLLTRLYEMRDLQRRMRREGRRHPVVAGSQGQPVVNPLLDEADRLETLIQKLDAVFGRGPLARLKLGIALGDAAASLDALNRSLTAPDADDEADDPRVAAQRARAVGPRPVPSPEVGVTPATD